MEILIKPFQTILVKFHLQYLCLNSIKYAKNHEFLYIVIKYKLIPFNLI